MCSQKALVGVVGRGTFEYAASRGGGTTEPPAFQGSVNELRLALQPPDSPEVPVNYRFEPFRTHLGRILDPPE